MKQKQYRDDSARYAYGWVEGVREAEALVASFAKRPMTPAQRDALNQLLLDIGDLAEDMDKDIGRRQIVGGD